MKRAKLIETLLAVGLVLAGCSNAKAEPNRRVVNGFLISFDYRTPYDFITSTIVTSDGNVWEVDDYVCNCGAQLQVTFDTMGTDNITDDQIVKIVATVEK